ncbi:MAG: anti-sigma factor antagonist [Bacteroidales bacterium]|nr:anti-sigma factor antagonist [Bacteroidales bacterium]
MDNYSISMIPNQEMESSGLLELKGELSIQYIYEIKDQIEKAIAKFVSVEILLTDVSIIDLAMMQYLLSLKKSEKSLGKSFQISFDIDEDINELLQHAGFKNIENINE